MIGYADDWVIYAAANSYQEACDRVKDRLNNVEAWTLKNGFTISPSKTKAMIITHRKLPTQSWEITIRNQPVEIVQAHRILGLIFDSKLSWKNHLKQVKQKAEKKLSIIKCLAGTTWGADQDVLLTVHRSVVLGTLRYGEQVYGSASDCHLNKLEATHNKGIRAAIGAFCITKTERLLEEAGSPTLAQMRLLSTITTAIHISSNPKHPLYLATRSKPSQYAKKPLPQPLIRRTDDFFRQHNIELVLVEKIVKNEIPPWSNNIDQYINTQLMTVREENNHTKQTAFNEVVNHHHTSIYTDGSKTDTACGYGVVVNKETVARRRLHNISSIYTCEIRAIIEATKIQPQYSKPATIYSDSLSAITATQNSSTKETGAVKLRNIIYSANGNLNLCWTPAHCGIGGNEAADLAAGTSLNLELSPSESPN
jgi:ribonuclease HI